MRGEVQEVGFLHGELRGSSLLDDHRDVVGVALDDVEVLLPALLGSADVLEFGLLRPQPRHRLEQVHFLNKLGLL